MRQFELNVVRSCPVTAVVLLQRLGAPTQQLTHPKRSTNRSPSRTKRQTQKASLRSTRIVQLLWSGFLTATIGFPAATSHGWIGAMVASLLLLNFIACIVCFWDFRLGWLTAMLFIGVVLIQQLWVNLFITGRLVRGLEPNPLGTTMLVAINSVLLIAPATLICTGYFINRRRIADILMSRRLNGRNQNAPIIEFDVAAHSNPYFPPLNNELAEPRSR